MRGRECEYSDVCAALKKQADELKSNRDDQVEANERTRSDIREENECLMEKRRQAALDVAELEQRKYALMDFVNKTESYWRNPDVSEIQADGTEQCGDVNDNREFTYYGTADFFHTCS